MRLTHRVLKALTGPKDQFQIAGECGSRYRVQDVFSILINLENQGVVVQRCGLWQRVAELPVVASPRWDAANSIFNMAEAA